MHRPRRRIPDAPQRPPRPGCADCRASPLGPSAPPARLGALRDQPPLLLRQCSVKVQHEGGCIPAQFSNDERHTLRHQPRYECHVTGKPVELGHDDRAFLLPSCGQRRGKLGPSVEGIIPLPCFHLDEFRRSARTPRPRRNGSRRLPAGPRYRALIGPGGRWRRGNRQWLVASRQTRWPLYKTHTTVCVLYVAKSLAKLSNLVPNRWRDDWRALSPRPAHRPLPGNRWASAVNIARMHGLSRARTRNPKSFGDPLLPGIRVRPQPKSRLAAALGCIAGFRTATDAISKHDEMPTPLA